MLVFGGSLGARSINLAAVEAFAAVAPSPTAASARARHGATTPELAAARSCAGRGYDLREYLDLSDFAQALAAADLVVARSGGSVFEIAAHGLPAILVPYPHAAADHQTRERALDGGRGRRGLIADEELSAERLARRGRGAAGRPPAPGGDGARPREPRAPGRRAAMWPASSCCSPGTRGHMSGRRAASGAGGGCTSSVSAAPA